MDFTRRDALGLLGAGAAASLLAPHARGQEATPPTLPSPNRPAPRPLSKPITTIICGYGGRGGLYGYYATQMPDTWKVVGVAEPISYRRIAAQDRHGLATDQTWLDFRDVLDGPKRADTVTIGLPDKLHYEAALMALDAGYDLLLEKPIAQNYRQVEEIAQKAERLGRIVAVCHVLRYAPYFVQLKAVIESGMIGDVVSIQHMEPIHHLHFAHSYVRGPWHKESDSTPSLLAKSCHDLDLIHWWVDKKCTKVSSMGGLKKYSRAYKPEGAPRQCLDGCPAADTCIYHAGKVYVEKKMWSTHHIITADRSDESILLQLRQGQYGRCVYQHENDVCDHQVVNMEFEGGATAAFSMEACTSYGGRRTRVMGSKGDIVGDEQFLDVSIFDTGQHIRWDVNAQGLDLSGHGGGDQRLVIDFCQAVAARDDSDLATRIENSLPSHRIGYAAEDSRRRGGQVIRL